MSTSSVGTDGLPFVKGHGTENDFVLIPDQDGSLELTAELAARLCERRTGPGADGAIRVAPHAAGGFFMDYRNADGSLAEMCGNGARVFARFLVDAGWAAPGRIDFETRAGRRSAELSATGDVSVGMGGVTVGAPSAATVSGMQIRGTAVDVGNPHLVCWVDDPDRLDLTIQPGFDPAVFPNGVNLEFIARTGEDSVRMRVHERGSGETRSCGTGTVAAAAVALAADARTEGTIEVTVPGGRVVVEIADGTAVLTGPAVLSYSGTINPAILGATAGIGAVSRGSR